MKPMKPMKKLGALFALLLCIVTSPLHAQLPPEIEYDRMLATAQRYFAQQEYTQATAEIENMREFAKKHKLKESDDFLFLHAQISAHSGEYIDAIDLLHQFLREHGNTSSHYDAALQLLVAQEALSEEMRGELAFRDDDGNTKLHLAVTSVFYIFDSVAINVKIKQLLVAGADINATNSHGQTPLHKAVMAGYPAVIETLLAAGANVNLKDNHGETPLHRAVLEERVQQTTIEALLVAGADVNAQDATGETPLHEAVEYGQRDAIITLLKNGANLKIKNNDKQNVREFCRKKHSRKKCDVLLKSP